MYEAFILYTLTQPDRHHHGHQDSEQKYQNLPCDNVFFYSDGEHIPLSLTIVISHSIRSEIFAVCRLMSITVEKHSLWT